MRIVELLKMAFKSSWRSHCEVGLFPIMVGCLAQPAGTRSHPKMIVQARRLHGRVACDAVVLGGGARAGEGGPGAPGAVRHGHVQGATGRIQGAAGMVLTVPLFQITLRSQGGSCCSLSVDT